MARVAEALVWWVVLTGIWWATLSSATSVELLSGAVFAVPGALAAVAARRALDTAWRPSVRWLYWLARVPGSVLTDSARVLFTRPKPTTRTVPSDSRAFAGVLVNATPGTVVVDAGPRSLTVHALGEPSALERAVGR